MKCMKMVECFAMFLNNCLLIRLIACSGSYICYLELQLNEKNKNRGRNERISRCKNVKGGASSLAKPLFN